MPRRDQHGDQPREELPDDVLRAINALVGSVDPRDPAALRAMAGQPSGAPVC